MNPFDASKHPKAPAGSGIGGQFVPTDASRCEPGQLSFDGTDQRQWIEEPLYIDDHNVVRHYVDADGRQAQMSHSAEVIIDDEGYLYTRHRVIDADQEYVTEYPANILQSRKEALRDAADAVRHTNWDDPRRVNPVGLAIRMNKLSGMPMDEQGRMRMSGYPDAGAHGVVVDVDVPHRMSTHETLNLMVQRARSVDGMDYDSWRQESSDPSIDRSDEWNAAIGSAEQLRDLVGPRTYNLLLGHADDEDLDDTPSIPTPNEFAHQDLMAELGADHEEGLL